MDNYSMDITIKRIINSKPVVTYVKVKPADVDEYYYLGEPLLEKVMKDREYEVVEK